MVENLYMNDEWMLEKSVNPDVISLNYVAVFVNHVAILRNLDVI